MEFITKLNFQTDVNLLNQDLENLLKIFPWPTKNFEKKSSGNQISITHRPGKDIWEDGTRMLHDRVKKEFIATEADFTEFNPMLGEYTKDMLRNFSKSEGMKLGRIRYMRLEPKKGLSVHRDSCQRYHFALSTNPNSFFAEKVNEGKVAAKCYHIPADGFAYKVDTLRDHFVYNGGWEDRIHIVVCAV